MNLKTMNLKINPVSFQEIADPESLSLLGKIGRGIALLYQAIKENKVHFPRKMEVSGAVGITNLPPVKIDNLHDLGSYFSSLEKRIGSLAQAIQAIRIENTIEADKEGLRVVSKTLASLEKALLSIGGTKKESSSPMMSEEDSRALQGIESAIKNLYSFEVEKPTFVPPPVTNVNINGLNGAFLSTKVSVTTTATALPTTALTHRRGLLVYNNSSVSLYIGDSTVDTNGFIIPASSYSPPFDAGDQMTLYGVVATGTADVRVIEMSNTNLGR